MSPRSTILSGAALPVFPLGDEGGSGELTWPTTAIYVDQSRTEGDGTGTMVDPFARVQQALEHVGTLLGAGMQAHIHVLQASITLLETISVTWALSGPGPYTVRLIAGDHLVRFGAFSISASAAPPTPPTPLPLVMIQFSSAAIGLGVVAAPTFTGTSVDLELQVEECYFVKALSITTSDGGKARARFHRCGFYGGLTVTATGLQGRLEAVLCTIQGDVTATYVAMDQCRLLGGVITLAPELLFTDSSMFLSADTPPPGLISLPDLTAAGMWAEASSPAYPSWPIPIGLWRCALSRTSSLVDGRAGPLAPLAVPCDDTTLASAKAAQISLTNAYLFAPGPSDDSEYGNGSDGDYTVPASTTVVLTEDKYYDTLVVDTGAVLNTAGYRVFCQRALYIKTGAEIRADASGSTGGGHETFLLGGNGGLDFGVDLGVATEPAVGSIFDHVAVSKLSPVTATGGTGGFGGSAGVKPPGDGLGPWGSHAFAAAATRALYAVAGWGGTAGKDGEEGIGGAGGGGGGGLYVAARAVQCSPTGKLTARGGVGTNGEEGSNTAALGGGGGGGGTGGAIFLLTDYLLFSAPGDVFVVSGGAGGLGADGAAPARNGTAGGDGVWFYWPRREYRG